MTPREKMWWSMTLTNYTSLPRARILEGGKEGRKAGRIHIKWLCQREGITPYVAPTVTPAVEATIAITPIYNGLINKAEDVYKKWPAAELLELAMQRSYYLLKDSNGKLLSKSIVAMANWLAAWDVLKSEREKKWWLGDGIDFVNKAKVMEYQGPSRKYETIVWLRSTPEASEVDVTGIAEPTPNKLVLYTHHIWRKAQGDQRVKRQQPTARDCCFAESGINAHRHDQLQKASQYPLHIYAVELFDDRYNQRWMSASWAWLW
ncbi:hypothetical protein BDZ45DRAFT_736633 [Acephala macrosclerotiorum]|nr:hypothetical protein BDZ45DRAFT_736633 [Acephala macrosclerotiorum]